MDYVYKIVFNNNYSIIIDKFSCKETDKNIVVYLSLYNRQNLKKELLNKIQNNSIKGYGICAYNFMFSSEEELKNNVTLMISSFKTSMEKDIFELNKEYEKFNSSEKETYINDNTLETQKEIMKNFRFDSTML